jgi:hypothetical protein
MANTRIDRFEESFYEHPTVFYGTRSENEEAYSESHKLNAACAEKLEKALADHFYGYHLDTNAVLEDMQEYDGERISIVLANTMRLREGDGRFSAANREWAKNIRLPASALSDRGEFVESHSVKVDAFAKAFREREREQDLEVSKNKEAAVSQVSHEAQDLGLGAGEQIDTDISPVQESRAQDPNMAEVQAAEMKASVIQGLDKSADGSTQVEGQDIGYAEEGYVAAAGQVQYEAQRARAAQGEYREPEPRKLRDSINPKIGQRVVFQPYDTKTTLTGKVVDMDDCTVTIQSGRTVIPALRDKGTFTEAPEPDRSQTKEHAKAQAQKHVGEQGKVFLAQGGGETYKGVIVEKTPTFAIQKINAETAVLHRLKDLEAKEKDGHGVPLKENEDFHLIQEGKEVSITRDTLEKGGVTIKSWDREKEERQKVRELERSRGSQSR